MLSKLSKVRNVKNTTHNLTYLKKIPPILMWL